MTNFVLPKQSNTPHGGCQAPKRLSPLIKEALKLGCVIASYPPLHWVYIRRVNVPTAKSQNLAINEANLISENRVQSFIDYKNRLKNKLVIIRNINDAKKAKVIRQSDSSRYFPKGRKRIKAKIIKRMGGFFSSNGILATFTYDPKKISRIDAWGSVGRDGRRILKEINRYRKRNGLTKVRGIKTVEVQKKTGYPHLHIAFPNLKWLGPIGKINELWGQAVNSVDITYRDNFSPCGYVCKYISKLDGWEDESMAELWLNGTRLYSMSRDYYMMPLEKRILEWEFYCAKMRSAINMRELMTVFDSVECDDQEIMFSGFT